tara:strand:- start:11979 stop:12167 length:189 start_codon:yes stop_codon:yes gene_type:complete
MDKMLGSDTLKIYHVLYIPYDRLLDKENRYNNQLRLLVYASSGGEAKEYAKKVGYITKINKG